MPTNGDSFGSRELVGEKNYYIDFTAPAADGVWMDFRGVKSGTVHVTALSAGDALVVQVSNAAIKPANTVDGVTSDTINGSGAAQHVAITKLPCNWLKIDKTGSTAVATGTVKGLAR